MRACLFLLLLILSFVINPMAQGAKAPNAVEKTVTLCGDQTKDLTDIFSFSEQISLPLGEADSWAVYLLKQDTPQKLLNTNSGVPERFNVIKIKGNCLEIGPFWLNLATSLPDSIPGSYSFSSPSLSTEQAKSSVWGPVITALERDKSKVNNPGSPVSHKTFKFNDGGELEAELWERQATFTVRIVIRNISDH